MLFSIKLHPDGSLYRYKDQLVVLIDKQEYGLHYDKTFALVAKMTTIQTILALVNLNHGPYIKWMLKKHFLHNDLKEDLYIKSSSNMLAFLPIHVCKLKTFFVWFEIGT